MRKKPPKRYHKNRIEEAKRQHRIQVQTDLRAKSSKTGLVLTFGNIEGWEQAMSAFEIRKDAQRAQLYSSLSFYKWLKTQNIRKENCSLFFEKGYRYANPVYGPRTIVGSISDGGRFNVGGAQLDPNFSDLAKQGALYLASSEKCAKEEASKPIGKHKLYELKANKKLKLWDLKKVIEELDYPNLFELVRSDHGEKIWAYQKIPTVSQILATHLRSIDGDGLVFESTKVDGATNITLFFNDDDHVKRILAENLLS